MPPQLLPLPLAILEELKTLPVYGERTASTLKTDYHMLVGLYNDVGSSDFVGATIEDEEFGTGYLLTLDRIRNYPAKAGKPWNYNTAKHRLNVYSRFILDVIWANVDYRRLYLPIFNRNDLESQLEHCKDGITSDIDELADAGTFLSLSDTLAAKWVFWESWVAAGRIFIQIHPETELLALQVILMFYLFQQKCRRLEFLSLCLDRGPEHNYISDDNTTVILNKYKTASVYGPYEFRMRPHVKRVYLRLVDVLKAYPEVRYIFGTPGSIQTIPGTQKLQQLNRLMCGVDLGVDNLRHMWYQYKVVQIAGSGNVAKDIVAKQMGTSIQQLTLVYDQTVPAENCDAYSVNGMLPLYVSRQYATVDQKRILLQTYNHLWGPDVPRYVRGNQWVGFINRFTADVPNSEIRQHFGHMFGDTKTEAAKARKLLLHWGRQCAKENNIPYS